MIEILWAFEEESSQELVSFREMGLVLSGWSMQLNHSDETGKHLQRNRSL